MYIPWQEVQDISRKLAITCAQADLHVSYRAGTAIPHRPSKGECKCRCTLYVLIRKDINNSD